VRAFTSWWNLHSVQVGRSESAPLPGKPARSAGSTFLLLACFLLATTGLAAAERIPPAPPRYFNDYANVVRRDTADALNRQLEQFERDSSNQVLVVIYPKMESDSSVEDYTVRVAQSWKAGQQGRNNGAVLFAFMQERQLYIQVGYGLEGAIPDAIAKRIIEQEIVPRFRAGDVDGGMTAAVNALIAAAKGEYKGTGATRAEGRRGNSGKTGGAGLFVLFIIIFLIASRRRQSALPYIIGGALLNSGRSRSRGGSSWGGGGGGGFSGGGGSFGGGGAGGRW
jgi:uncharacterized protein